MRSVVETYLAATPIMHIVMVTPQLNDLAPTIHTRVKRGGRLRQQRGQNTGFAVP